MSAKIVIDIEPQLKRQFLKVLKENGMTMTGFFKTKIKQLIKEAKGDL